MSSSEKKNNSKEFSYIKFDLNVTYIHLSKVQNVYFKIRREKSMT